MARIHNTKRPRSKAELLPLPAALVRNISLENHLALATMRAGHGTAETMIALLRVLYLAYFAVEPDLSEADRPLFLEVESVLSQSIEAAGNGQAWQLSEEALGTVERLLLRSDVIIGSVPKYRYLEAWDRLGRFAESAHLSPIPGSTLNEGRV
ncbi:hypothetical protein [Burkholderia ambifaria]|uniref:hypothetical protein n=1 Tax=Burkholderia ambifaria TaxID=152480 RepID=UPI00158EAA27|nr:hypothetical protein [Burkholderia ambifaria]